MRCLTPDLRLRTRRLNRRRFKRDQRYVLCWLQQALRATDNPIIDVAVSLGNEFGLPVLVYHGLDNRYPYASWRLHRFILEASASLDDPLSKRRLRFCRYVRRREKPEPHLVYRLADSAACIVTDDMPTFVARRQAESVAKKAPQPVLVVDAACAVPMSAFSRCIEATRDFRAAHRPLRDSALEASTDTKPSVRKFTGKLCFEHDDLVGWSSRKLDALIRRCDVDMTLPVANGFRGGRAVALMMLKHAIHKVIPRYKWTRNNPADPDSTTKLSPFMHFGVLGPREVVQAVRGANLHSAARWKFFDELLTWREYCHHLARFSDDPASYQNVPEWARGTLADHVDDVRPKIYSVPELLHAQTDDDVWNAAQRQFLLDGWMHNNLRMYWVKQIIRWRPTPQNAWEVACYLNDRLSLDGRDPATYGGIQWGFGRSRKAYRESDIYGWVPLKSDAALRKRKGFESWMKKQNRRKMIKSPVDDVGAP